jgi:uncharacterized protein YbcC (UPF0753/DUF2309 family)
VANYSLAGVSTETVEAQYQALYAACAAGEVDEEAIIRQIDSLFQQSKSPVIKSYCLLFYSAVADTNTLNAGTLKRLSHLLNTLLIALSDYRVKDTEGRYIHFLIHAIYRA